MAVMVLCFSGGEKARKVLENGSFLRGVNQMPVSDFVTQDLLMLGDPEGIIGLHIQLLPGFFDLGAVRQHLHCPAVC